jgi:DNA-binding transcriptional regulator YbjK
LVRKLEGFSSQERLLEATIDLWGRRGHAALSARILGQEADLPVSSLYHHFGGMEQLYVSAQEQARAAAERWCQQQLATFATVGGGLPAVMAALIDEWTTGQRRLAFAMRECQLMALREARYLPSLRSWQSLWSSFWQEVCSRCGIQERAELTTYLFYSESLLHLLQWRRIVDRACLTELCEGWGSWLSGRLTPEGPWRAFARQEAGRSLPEPTPRTETTQKIATAAAEIVEELGMAGLTHRAVAARAGLTLGIVSYNFRTSAELTRAAFESIYARLVADGPVPAAGQRDAAFAALSGFNLLSSRLTGVDEVLLSVARDPELLAYAPQLRYLRGRGSGVHLQALLGPQRPISPTDAALMSGFTGGQRQACLGRPPEEAAPMRQRTLTALLDMLDQGAV